MAAGLREAWAYVWPRDAGTAALAFAESGHAEEARAIARFLTSLDLAAGARFNGDGTVVADGRPAQGDAGGWTRLAREAAGPPARRSDRARLARAARLRRAQRRRRRLHRERDRRRRRNRAPAQSLRGTPRPARATSRAYPAAELDSATAWAVRPFPHPALAGAVAATLRAVGRTAGPYGLEPHTGWPGTEPVDGAGRLDGPG